MVADLKSKDPLALDDVLRLSGSNFAHLRIKNGAEAQSEQVVNNIYSIFLDQSFEIDIGSDDDLPNLYDRVTVYMDKDKNIYDLHEALSLLDLDHALHASAASDIERMKLGHLFHIFSPRESTHFEREDAFIDLPIDALKARMIEQNPDMASVFDTYLPQMELYEIMPGKTRFAIKGLGQEAYERGARGLTAAMMGAEDANDMADRLISLLNMGMLSHETRNEIGVPQGGLSSWGDYYSGGADSVFTQMISERSCDANEKLSHALWYYSKYGLQLVLSLDALDTGSYQYLTDNFGNRRFKDDFWFDSYDERPNLFEFIDELNANPWHGGHEIMFKERLDPAHIKGVIVSSNEIRDELYLMLRDRGALQVDSSGAETIFGRDLEQFIRVGKSASEELFA